MPNANKIIASNVNRKDIYRTEVLFMNIGGKNKVIKRAGCNDAAEFIKTIHYNEAIANKYFMGKAEVIVGKYNNNQLEYEYMPYSSLEELINNYICKDESTYGEVLIDEYIKFIKSLPSLYCIPTVFIKTYGINPLEIKNEIHCLKVSPIDCIPCNILVNNHQWYIIDNEWIFDYPIPIDFIIFRGIYSLMIHLQNTIRSHMSEARQVVLFNGYGNKKTYLPFGWFKILNNNNISTEKYFLWEYFFQKSILKKCYLGSFRLKKYPELVYNVDEIKYVASEVNGTSINNRKTNNILKALIMDLLSYIRMYKYGNSPTPGPLG